MIQKVAPTGQLLQTFDVPGVNASVGAVAVDAHGNVYIADQSSGLIIKYAPTGELLAIWK